MNITNRFGSLLNFSKGTKLMSNQRREMIQKGSNTRKIGILEKIREKLTPISKFVQKGPRTIQNLKKEAKFPIYIVRKE